jgi:hypothetical protein
VVVSYVSVFSNRPDWNGRNYVALFLILRLFFSGIKVFKFMRKYYNLKPVNLYISIDVLLL